MLCESGINEGSRAMAFSTMPKPYQREANFVNLRLKYLNRASRHIWFDPNR